MPPKNCVKSASSLTTHSPPGRLITVAGVCANRSAPPLMVTAPKFSSVRPSRMSFTPVPLKLFTVPAPSTVRPVPIMVPPVQANVSFAVN